jgi:hypothetical protein
MLLIVVGPADWPDHDQQHCYHHARTIKPETATAVVELLMLGYHQASTVKPEAATAIVELLMMGVRTPETC